MKISLDNSYIAVLIKDTDINSPAITHGIKLANTFSLGLMLVVLENEMSDARKKEFEDFVAKIGNQLSLKTRFLNLPFPRKRKDMMQIEEEGSLLLVLDVNQYKSKFIAKFCMCLKNPYLCISKKPEEVYENIVIRATINKLSREKIIWATFIAKKCNAKVIIVREKFEDEFLSKEVRDYIAFSKKYFEDHDMKYQVVDYDPKKSLLENCKLPNSAFIYTTSCNCFIRSVLKLKTTEERIIKEANGYALLFLNTNNEMYDVYNWK